MWKSIFSVENIVSSTATLLIFGGVIAAGIFRAEPNLVNNFTLLALCGLFLETGLRWSANQSFNRLSTAEATDLSFLRQIRFLLKQGQVITEEHLSVSEAASKAADDEYRKFHGFSRPPIAVEVGSKSLKTDSI